jgi:hypothetical protein
MFSRVLLVLAAAGLVFGIVPAASAVAANGQSQGGPLTLAVFGDSPYGTSGFTAPAATPPVNQADDHSEFDNSGPFLDSMDSDPAVSAVVHVGDIHSGKQFCTQAYDQSIYDMWSQHFRNKPLVYTPGDNEWADCHKAKKASGGAALQPQEGGGYFDAGVTHYITQDPSEPTGVTTDASKCVDYACGNPTDNLALVRGIFFQTPGQTLGNNSLSVVSQANECDATTHACDYVENVRWVQNDVVFVTMNIPGGSNNDADIWYKTPAETAAQTNERNNRTAADVSWLDAAFDVARSQHAKGVVIIEQADMWDLDGATLAVGAPHLANYNGIIQHIADDTTALGRPVLLFEGDSHTYRSDNPLRQGAPCESELATACSTTDAWTTHPALSGISVSDSLFHRVVVHGSTTPFEWLKLTVDPNSNSKPSGTAFGPFSWQRMTQS